MNQNLTLACIGIGLYTAINLAKMNCRIIIASRNSEKSKSAVEKIKQESSNSNIDYELVDLLDFSNISQFTQLISGKLTSLDYLILNSGATFYEFGESKDGIEKTVQLNHLGHLLLTMNLLPIIKKAEKARIIFVSSACKIIFSYLIFFTN
jgi:NAD(P)-dependent dehydrogenase (short-subunit alcohol dehydrogenase family)